MDVSIIFDGFRKLAPQVISGSTKSSRSAENENKDPNDSFGERMLDFGQFNFGQFFGQLAEIELAEVEQMVFAFFLLFLLFLITS